MADIVREYSVDQRLVSDTSAFGFLAEARENARIQPDRDELTRVIAERRSAHAPHRAELVLGGLRQIREINLSWRPCTRTFLSGSLAAH